LATITTGFRVVGLTVGDLLGDGLAVVGATVDGEGRGAGDWVLTIAAGVAGGGSCW
jgi:hypothetical protein